MALKITLTMDTRTDELWGMDDAWKYSRKDVSYIRELIMEDASSFVEDCVIKVEEIEED